MLPSGFLWGASASGFQFEMGDPAGKYIDPNTDWYVWVHDVDNIAKGIVSGDLPERGIGYWEFYSEDHELAKELGFNTYRIGIEWSRIFPKSTTKIEVEVKRDSYGLIEDISIDESILSELDRIANKEAIEYYRAIIKDIKEKGMRVFVCLNHFTLPLWIHDPIRARRTKLKEGPRGWVDENTVVEFVKYVAYVAWKLGDLVDDWAIFNEPMVVAELGYTMPEAGFPPGVADYGAYLKTLRNLALAHARAYDAIKRWDRVRADPDSKASAYVGLIHNVIPVHPLFKERREDVQAAELLNYTHNKWIVDAIVKGGLDLNLDGKVEVTAPHMANKLDWIGINYYTRMVVRARAKAPFFELVEGLGFACAPHSLSIEGRPTSDFGWEIYPEGLIEAIELMAVYKLPMIITENGIADAEDKLRPGFIVAHIKKLEEAIERGYKIDGYLHWALTDNYEWAKGFSMKFGLVEVDLKTKKRIRRKSAFIYKEIIENNGITSRLEREYLR
ncbi:MAG: glycoside hydrolase family 1 protein [Thermoprotei archaeon]|nr:MAG: glycoside hydrolase family 1 protein [Thermoprotei archaeon]RLF23822.1 MAG: glycoside hydrolase family 1 protein [Thermoprotei archaeon]